MKRLLPIILACFAAGGLCSAQNLAERSQSYDMSRINDMQDRKFEGGGSLKIKAAQGWSKNAQGSGTFETGDYEYTRSFLGIKNPWIGGKVLKTKPANLSNNLTLKNLEKEVATEDASMERKAVGTSKSAPTPGIVPVKTYEARGSAQGALNKENEGVNKEMSVEELREILNKNR